MCPAIPFLRPEVERNKSGSKLEITQQADPTDIYIYENIIWRGEMGSVDPSRVRMAYIGPDKPIYLETSFYGSVIAPRAKMVMGQHTGCAYYGRYFARELEIHQGTVIFETQFHGERYAPQTTPVLAWLSFAA